MRIARSNVRPARSSAAIVLSNVGADLSDAMRSISSSSSCIAASSAGWKCSTRTRSKGGTQPYGTVQGSRSGFKHGSFSKACARVGAGEAREQVIDFGPGCGREGGRGLAKRVRGDDSALHEHVLAHREPRARLLLV